MINVIKPFFLKQNYKGEADSEVNGELSNGVVRVGTGEPRENNAI